MPIFECKRCNELTYSASVESEQPCRICGADRHRVLEGTFESVRTSTRDLSPGDHSGHVYTDPAAIAPFCARYLTEGLDTGQRVMAVVPDDLKSAIQALLGPDEHVAVEWQDPETIYWNFQAERVATMYDELIGGEPRTMRILAVWDRSAGEGVETAEFDRYECVAHEIVTRHGAIALCLYDARDLEPGFLVTAARRHGLCVSQDAVHRNEMFEFQPV